MAAAQERMATLEARVNAHAQALTAISDSIAHLEQRVDLRFSQVDLRFSQIDQRFSQVDQRFSELEDRVDARFDAVDRRFERIDTRLDRLEDRMSRQFVWTVGILITMLAIIVGGFVSTI